MHRRQVRRTHVAVPGAHMTAGVHPQPICDRPDCGMPVSDPVHDVKVDDAAATALDERKGG